jgi:hexosaminidase
MKKIHTLTAIFFAFLSIAGYTEEPVKQLSIIPIPSEVRMKSGSFMLGDQTLLLLSERDETLRSAAMFFAEQMRICGGPVIKVAAMDGNLQKTNIIVFSYLKDRSGIPAEGYRLKVTKNNIHLEAGSAAGVFYGMQTLLQMLPAEIFRPGAPSSGISWEIPCAEINDHPAFPYRGMHLDVSRHFFPKEFIKQYIDLIAMYKMNTFHWHLTDDNGWRIEIKKYPKLTEVGAWHVDREHLPWGERPAQKPGEKATYGGYYTQEEVREIVAYAAQRFVTVIPEIEMPAHSLEVLAAYPGLSCTGGPFTVPPGSYWPNADILCAGNDSVFTFLEDVLTEVIPLFPGPYIHLGGDEADKTNWKTCPKCQARIKSLGLKDEKELQSYFMRRMEKFVVSQNKKMIGWDEILEGGLAPEATVMSWRGIEGGIAAARQGHDAIMTPTSHCYFDYYQGDPESEPKAIGGFTTLKRVYSYKPVPSELNPEQQKHILGAQGNLWTEFIPTPEHAEYMAIPRMIALAEVVWSPEKTRNWDEFRQRLQVQYKRLDYMNVNYSLGSFKAEISTKWDQKKHNILVSINSEQLNIPIFYTTDGKDPDTSAALYSAPFVIGANAIIKAGLFPEGKLKGKITEMPIVFHHAIGKPVKYLRSYSYRYPAAGDMALTDGLRGSTNHRDGLWQGYLGNDMEVVIDLGKEQQIMSVMATCLQNQRSWIFLPERVEFSLSSNGKDFHSVNDEFARVQPTEEQVFIQPFSHGFPKGTTARYIKIKAVNRGVCPSWHEGAGDSCWIFIDEVTVY